MPSLEVLLADARSALDGGRSVVLDDAEAETARVLQICNACRYCEGYCAVFPAMTRRLEFASSDIHYLANLCHNCGACLHACQYAAPHEFAVNVPRSMARVRVESYAAFAWPPAFGRFYQRNGLLLALVFVVTMSLCLSLATRPSLDDRAPANFYAVLPHSTMAWMFGPIFAFAIGALILSGRRFWHAVRPGPVTSGALAEAGANTGKLTYLGGGHGEGCNEDDDAFTLARRRFHHLVFYGFLLCFASTSVATFYHYGLNRPAPYDWTTLPKWLGTLGGLGLVTGCTGLAWLNRRRDPRHGDTAQKSMDLGFIALLFTVAASGLSLPFARTLAPGVMPWNLCLHLGAVMALFATLPYGKFVHGIFRGVALVAWAVERRRPDPLASTVE